ncbi:putative ABC transport system ATP-binding protein [Aequitasia blattaphilus]|nr:ABC transporter ATP-binding protein [Aequitasia blattaphilus]
MESKVKKILNIKSLYKYYESGTSSNKVKAINRVSMEIESGEFVGIMGASGSGKTTLLNIIATIDEASEGVVNFNGIDITKLSDEQLSKLRNEKIGLIFQDYNLLDTLTLYENILLAVVNLDVNDNDIRKKIIEIAEELGIREVLNHYPYEVSGGQRQRCACARAIIKKPEIILADEPTGALDTNSSHALLGTLETLNKKYNSTILMVTHDPVAASYCSRILVLNDGKICAEILRGEKSKKQLFNDILKMNITFSGGLDEIL